MTMRRNPSRSVRRRRRKATARRAVTVYQVNPHRRRRRRARTALSRALPFRTNPARRYRRRRNYLRGFRRNPIGRGALGMGQVTALIVPGILTGGGAVLAELGMGYLPLPASWKTGYVRHLVKGAISVVGGLVVADVLKMPRLGEYIALGGIAIAAHDTLKEVITTQMPGMQFGSYMPSRALPHQFGFVNSGMVGGFQEYVPTPAPQF